MRGTLEGNMIRPKIETKSRAVTPRTKQSKSIVKRKAVSVATPPPARADEERELVVLAVHPEPEDAAS
jgi:hypothetical protein